MDHGIASSNNITSNKKFNKIIKLLKYIKIFIYHSLINKKNIIYDLYTIFNIFLLKKYNRLKFNYAIFFSEYNRQELSGIIKTNFNKYDIVGYPIFSSMRQNLEKRTNENLIDEKKILYIHQPFILDKLSEIDYSLEKCYIMKIYDVVIKNKYELIIKIHPRESISNYSYLSNLPGCTLVENGDLTKYVMSSNIVLGHTSAALLTALYFDKPLILLHYPKTKFALPKIFTSNFSYYELDSLDECIKLSEQNSDLFKTNDREFLIGKRNSYQEIAISILNKM